MNAAPFLNEAHPVRHQPSERPRWGLWATLAWGVPLVLTEILFQTLGAAGFMRWWRYAHLEQPIALESMASHGAVLAFAVLASTPPVLGLLAYAVRLSRHGLRDYLALTFPRWRDIGVGAAMLVVLVVAASVFAEFTGQETPEFMAATYRTARDTGMLPLLFVSFVVLAPLQEELLFRGFFFRGFAQSLGGWPAILLTAAAWALIHMQYQWFFVGEIFVLGVALGWIRWRSGSTLLTFVLHAVMNGAALVVAALMVET